MSAKAANNSGATGTTTETIPPSQQDRAILDVINDLLQPEEIPVTKVESWAKPLVRRRMILAASSMAAIGAIFMLLAFLNPYFYMPADYIAPNPKWAIPGIPLALLGSSYSIMALYFNQEVARAQRSDTLFSQRILEKRTDQRTTLVEKLTAAEAQKYASMGNWSAQDLQRAQMREARDHESEEAQKTRDHELELLKTKLDKERELLESRLKIEQPSADQKAADRRTKLESDRELMVTLNEMADSSDPKVARLAQQLWDRYERGEL